MAKRKEGPRGRAVLGGGVEGRRGTTGSTGRAKL